MRPWAARLLRATTVMLAAGAGCNLDDRELSPVSEAGSAPTDAQTDATTTPADARQDSPYLADRALDASDTGGGGLDSSSVWPDSSTAGAGGSGGSQSPDGAEGHAGYQDGSDAANDTGGMQGSGGNEGSGGTNGQGGSAGLGGRRGSGGTSGKSGSAGSDAGTGKDGSAGSDAGTGKDGSAGSDAGTGKGGSAGSDAGTGAGGTSEAGGSTGNSCANVAALDHPVAVATDGRAVVWVDARNVRMCPVGGCVGTPTSIVGAMAYPAIVNALALDATYAYWITKESSGTSVVRCPFTGCLTVPDGFVDPVGGPELKTLVVRASTVYMNDGGYLYRCPVAGCSGSRTQVFGMPDSSQSYLAADSNGLYFGMGGEAHGTYYCAFASCPPTLGAPLVGDSGLSAAANGVLYLLKYNGTLASCPSTGCSNIMDTLTTGQTHVTSMVADSSGVYWTTSGGADAGATGQVLTCSLPSCEGGPRVLASGQADPVSIAVSDHCVFWANRGLSDADGAIGGLAR